MKAGDRVKFVKAHHSMNPILRDHEGELGTIQHGPGGPKADEYVVEFDRRDDAYGRWWIKSKRLEVIGGSK